MGYWAPGQSSPRLSFSAHPTLSLARKDAHRPRHRASAPRALTLWCLFLLMPVLGCEGGLNTVDEFNNVKIALEQYADGGKMRTIPTRALHTFSQRLGRLLPTKPTYWAGTEIEGGPLVTTSRAKREARHAIMLPPVQCAGPGQTGQAPAGMSQTFQDSVCTGDQPDPTQVWEQLMLRREYEEEKEVPLNQLMVSFVNWFHEDSFRTVHGTDGAKLWTDKDPLTMSQVYGDSEERETALRTLQDGKLKSRLVDGEEWPPLWVVIRDQHPEFEMWVPHRHPLGAQNSSVVDTSEFMAFGDPRLNMHTGHVVWGTLFLRLHNHLCDVVLSERPSLSDQEVFNTARRLLTHVMLKVRTENFVSDAIAHFRDSGRIHYDPDALRALKDFQVDTIPPWLEFNLLYRWHWFIPENLRVPPGANDAGVRVNTTIPMRQTMWHPSRIVAQGLKGATQSLAETGVGKAGSNTIPSFLSHATLDAISIGRKQRLRGYNDYLRFFEMPPMVTMQDFGLNKESTAALEELYGHPDNVDYFVGIQIEKAGKIEGNPFGDGNLVLVALIALQDAVSHDAISVPAMWSEELLTTAGKQFILNFSLEDWISEVLGQRVDCPFFTTQDCTPLSQQKWPGDRTCRLENIGEFSGMDYLGDWIWKEDGYYMWSLSVYQAGVPLLVCLVYGATGMAVQRWEKSYPVMDSSFDLANLALLCNALVYTIMAVPVTWTSTRLLFSSSFDREVELNGEECYFYVAVTFFMHIAELVIRCFLRPTVTLVLHHALTGGIVCAIFWMRSIFGMRLGMILITFVFLEFPLFVAMAFDRLRFAPRLMSHKSFAKLVFAPLIGLYLFTRLLSIAILTGFMIATHDMMKQHGQSVQYWILCFCGITVSIMQFLVLSAVKRCWLRHTSDSREELSVEGSQDSSQQCLSAIAVYEGTHDGRLRSEKELAVGSKHLDPQPVHPPPVHSQLLNLDTSPQTHPMAQPVDIAPRRLSIPQYLKAYSLFSFSQNQISRPVSP